MKKAKQPENITDLQNATIKGGCAMLCPRFIKGKPTLVYKRVLALKESCSFDIVKRHAADGKAALLYEPVHYIACQTGETKNVDCKKQLESVIHHLNLTGAHVYKLMPDYKNRKIQNFNYYIVTQNGVVTCQD